MQRKVVCRVGSPFAMGVVRGLGLLLFLFAAGLGACDRLSLREEEAAEGEFYEIRPSQQAEGTGRFYMGREIAEVMGHRGAEWLERPSREDQELPGRVVQALDLSPSDVVADIGAGTGYFTFRISPKVPHGKVMAVDIDEAMLDLIRSRMEELGVDNVVPIKGTEADPHLPENSIDVALMVDAYHEFAYPREMMEHIVEALRPGGRVVLVEFRGEDPTIPVGPLHRMTAEQARREMEAVGLEWRETKEILPQQHFMIFEKPITQGGQSPAVTGSGLQVAR